MICARPPRKSRLARPRYYITSVWVCQGVFEKFFGFFQVFSWSSLEPFVLGLSPEVPDYYITTLFICQEVFEKFFKNFSWLFGSFLSESDPPIISHLFSFVKRFFKSFFAFFALFRVFQAPVIPSEKLLVSNPWVAVLQIDGSSVNKPVLLQHPPHDHVPTVGINPKRAFT